MIRLFTLSLFSIALLSCNSKETAYPSSSIDSANYKQTSISTSTLGAGFRFSDYGPKYNPGKEYWLSVGKQMASQFKNASPECIWIAGSLYEDGCMLSFPAIAKSKKIYTSKKDDNEETFNYFDKNGVRVWLQIEPGYAPIDELINLLLTTYSHHTCIIGIGIDVEWNRSTESPDLGEPVTDAQAMQWVNQIRSFNPQYRLFLKHWEINKMPPTVRDGLVFIDDSQEFTSLKDIVNEFAAWGKAFAPAKVGYQFGYEPDKTWWGKFPNPSKTIGDSIIANVPNVAGLYWVDFSVIDVFPPKK